MTRPCPDYVETGVEPRGGGVTTRYGVLDDVAGALYRVYARLGLGREVEVKHIPSMKEVYIVVGDKYVYVVKLSTRKWYTTPALLVKWARGVLARGKEMGRVVYPVLAVRRLSGGAARLAAEKRWLRVVPYRGSTPATLIRWILWKIAEMLASVRRRNRLVEKIRRMVEREAEKIEEIGVARDRPPG